MAQPLILQKYMVPDTDGSVPLEIQPGRITFILGRKGAGKTTLLAELSKLPGTFLIKAPREGDFENAADFLKTASKWHNNWNESIAREALGEFKLHEDSSVDSYSALLLAAVEALACREDFVLLDELESEMQDKDRKMFYMLMRDFCRRETAFVSAVSTMRDAEIITDDIVFIKGGEVIIAEEKRSLLSRAVYVGGNCAAVDINTDDLESYGKSCNGKITKVVCLLKKGENVAETCDVCVFHINLQMLYDYMCL